MVIDTQPLVYKKYDGGNQNDPRIAPVISAFLEMELRRSFCTHGVVYDMIADTFNQNSLYCMSNWHVGRSGSALTITVNLALHNTRIANENERLTN